MAKERILILDKERIGFKLQRMAYQVWEHNSKADAVTLIGVEGSGLAVAQSLAKRIREISPLKVEVLSLKLNKKKPLSKEIKVSEDITGRSVVLVDDVANSGKTLLYALRPLLDYELKSIQVAVLVDRKHKSFPISPDIVGHTIATTLQEHIEVETEGENIEAAYLQ
jgi:pyrimidine operon attenuation protein/uracil phosphoribosyltransferase